MGPYNNITNRYINLPQYENGAWLQNPETNELWIIPTQDVIAEIEGPDGETLDALNTIVREQNRFPNSNEIEALNLELIPNGLKCFDPLIGYYSA
jgi:hypothetical protein